jgi:hypothetical protein
MAKLVDGHWVALETDSSGFHRCNSNKPASNNQAQVKSIEPKSAQQTPQNDKLVIDVSTEAAILQAISVLYGKLSELKTRVAVAATTT